MRRISGLKRVGSSSAGLFSMYWYDRYKCHPRHIGRREEQHCKAFLTQARGASPSLRSASASRAAPKCPLRIPLKPRTRPFPALQLG